MARLFVCFALVLFVAVVVADYIYSDDQIDEINDRLSKCLRQVPARGDFDRPGDVCRFEGIYALADGATKEELTKPIVACLTGRKVKSTIVSSAEACLVKSLAADLTSA